MRIYLVRHGIAEDPALDRPDYARPLTPRGVDRMRLQARALRRANVKIDRLYTSPLVRAVQTADILGKELGHIPEQDQLIAPGCRIADVRELLSREPAARSVMLVGHQPDLGEIARALTGALAKMRKGMVVDIELMRSDAQHGILRGLYDPEVLAALGV